MAETFLVVGGAGYIGSVITEQIVISGRQAVVLDNLSRGHRGAVHPQARLIVADLADPAALAEIFAEVQPDAVLHFGALSQVGESVVKPLEYYQANVGNGMNLLHAMHEANVKRLVFSSTAAIFGNGYDRAITESDPSRPINPYGRTKWMFEQILQDCDTAWGLKSVCLRYFNAAGASQRFGEDHRPESHLIPLTLLAARGAAPALTIFGDDYPTSDGTCIRDYIHVEDLASAHLLALDHLMGNGESRQYNLGNGGGYSVRQVIDTAAEVTSLEVPHQTGPQRSGDPAILLASSERIQNELGWKPAKPELQTIIADAWKWMRENPVGYK